MSLSHTPTPTPTPTPTDVPVPVTPVVEPASPLPDPQVAILPDEPATPSPPPTPPPRPSPPECAPRCPAAVAEKENLPPPASAAASVSASPPASLFPTATRAPIPRLNSAAYPPHPHPSASASAAELPSSSSSLLCSPSADLFDLNLPLLSALPLRTPPKPSKSVPKLRTTPSKPAGKKKRRDRKRTPLKKIPPNAGPLTPLRKRRSPLRDITAAVVRAQAADHLNPPSPPSRLCSSASLNLRFNMR